jgi:DNA-directed RNA polymerase subunit F
MLAKEARNWAGDATKYAVQLQKLDPQESAEMMEELRLALSHKDDSINATTPGAPAPDTILH